MVERHTTWSESRPTTSPRMGIKYIPQDKKVFSDLTVRENLELGSYATKITTGIR